MNRTPMPTRKTPLKSSPLVRKTAMVASPLARSTLHANSATNRRLPKRQRNTGPPAKVRALVAARSGGWCEFAGCWVVAVQQHHRRPRRMGGSSAPGTNRASNLVHLCAEHHGVVESDRVRALTDGLLLHASADPVAVPVLLRHGLVWLADDGAVLTTNPINT